MTTTTNSAIMSFDRVATAISPFQAIYLEASSTRCGLSELTNIHADARQLTFSPLVAHQQSLVLD